MRKSLLAALVGWCMCAAGTAKATQPLDDGELSQVSGGDGVSFAVHLALNDPSLPDAVTDSRLSFGFNVDGKTTYMVFKNLRGVVDVFGVNLSAQKRPDGGDYMALTLPEYVKFNNYGFESLSVQADPLAPVTESLGRVNINGTLSMQGQFRLWAH
jgi:hypothetical protein